MHLNGRWGKGLALLLVGTVVALGMACGGGGGGGDAVSGTITGIKISGDSGICGGTYSYIVFTAQGDEDDAGVVLILIAAGDVSAFFTDSTGENMATGTISGSTMTLSFSSEDGATVSIVLVCADGGASFSGAWTETGGGGDTPVPDPTTPSTPTPSPTPGTPTTPTPSPAPSPATGSSAFAGSMMGTWSGTCSGFPASGTFMFTIAADGSVSGSYSGDDSGPVSGSVSDAGGLTVGGAAGSSTWVGDITKTGDTLSGGGPWSDPDCSGTWSGSGPAA